LQKNFPKLVQSSEQSPPSLLHLPNANFTTPNPPPPTTTTTPPQRKTMGNGAKAQQKRDRNAKDGAGAAKSQLKTV